MLTIEKLYELAIIYGIDTDPRGKKLIEEELKDIRKNYRSLKKEEKKEFDQEKLTNPFADTRILHGDCKKVIQRVLVGIDMEIGEILLADRLSAKGKPIDLVIAHHPEGYALAGFYEVMGMQADILHKFGVPINIAEGILKERISEVERKVLPVNHNRAVDAALLLDIPLMCIHTPTDNHVVDYLQKIFDKKKCKKLKDIVKELKNIPEYKEASLKNAGPKIITGSNNNTTGKIFVDMTGGTEGSKNSMEKLSLAGVGTLIGMHYSDDLRKNAEKHHINLIVAGHIPSDTLGMNLFLDKIEKDYSIEILTTSGYKRIKRI
ncbi:MAG: NGG1p interacting factor NIF3 [bacterium]|nr:NGG1p interacting factor NIF3 [bacterium]